MRYLLALLAALLAARPQPALAVEDARELAGYCQALERGVRGSGASIRIPAGKEALLCWGYMQAIQDLSVLVEPDGRRLLGSCPPETTTTLQLVRSFAAYARAHPAELGGNSAVVVIKALQQAYPCARTDASAPPPVARQ
jgi:hypothetical protein